MTKQLPNDDKVKQAELLRDAQADNFRIREDERKELSSKVTYLFGFTVSVITLYGTYATSVPPKLKQITLGFLVVTLILLCLAYMNRRWPTSGWPEEEDMDLNGTTYFDKVYKQAVSIKEANKAGDRPLRRMAFFVRLSLYCFTIGVACLALSFIWAVAK